MFWKRNAAITAVSGGVLSVVMLAAGATGARADELADLRANQELLQQRLDQLSQAPPAAAAPIGVGSFPRSFLIPGTDTSMRVGGQGVGSVVWYMKGFAVGGVLNSTGGVNETFTDGQGGTGNLPNMPLKSPTVGPAAGPAANAVGYAASRSSDWQFSGKQSQIFLDVRQPSPYGEIKAFVSFDFAASNTSTILNTNEGSVSGYIPRFREGYATFSGLLAGQTVGTFVDNDSTPELLDFGGETGTNFVARTPQVRYTYPLPNGQSVAVSAEQPNGLWAGPFGTFYEDTNAIPTASSCAAVVTPAPTATNPTNACLGNAAFFDASQQLMPTFVARWRIDQPWGHLQAGATTVGYTLNDGRGLNQQYIGYGGSISGHVFTWGKDNMGGGLVGGNGIGDQIGNGVGVATNFGAALAGDPITVNGTNSTSKFYTSRTLYDRAVLSQTIVAFAAHVYYQHWWTDQLRSSVDFSMNHNDVPDLPGYALSRQTGGNAGAINKELDLAHLNLVWSPVAFVDLGIEGAWGHRQVVSNLRGDCYTLQTAMKVRF
jgi:hypothetical protein